MKKYFAILLIAVSCSACYNPAEPSSPWHKCYTQPRGYFMLNADTGEVQNLTYEVDFYFQLEPCPAERIK